MRDRACASAPRRGILRCVRTVMAVLALVGVLAACTSEGDEGASSAGPTSSRVPTTLAVEAEAIVAEQTSISVSTTIGVCSWQASVAGHDGAGQRTASVFSLTNVSDGPCAVPSLVGVNAIADDGVLLADGGPGGFFAVEPLGAESIGVGERADFVLTTTSQELCGKSAQVLSTTVHVTLNDGNLFSVTFPWTLNVACGLQFSEATRWSDQDS